MTATERHPQRPGSWSQVLAPLAGLGTGAAIQLNRLAERITAPPSRQELWLSLALGAVAGAVLFALAQRLARGLLERLVTEAPARASVLAWHPATWLVFLLTAVGATGLRLPGPVLPLTLTALFLVLNLVLVLRAESSARPRLMGSTGWLGFLFFLSGMAALVYQVTWQRVLFASFGVNIESVTLVVTIFMFGLGVGSMLGGALSKRYPHTLPRLFLLCEVVVGAFGIISLPLIRAVGDVMVHSSLPAVALAISGLLAVPTLMMGATLPILVAHLHQHFQHVGRTVGLLYFVNTLGSAASSYLTASVLFVLGGQQAAVLCAAVLNLTVGALAWRYMKALSSRGGDSSLGPPLELQAEEKRASA
jgi:spermidine synthase